MRYASDGQFLQSGILKKTGQGAGKAIRSLVQGHPTKSRLKSILKLPLHRQKHPELGDDAQVISIVYASTATYADKVHAASVEWVEGAKWVL